MCVKRLLPLVLLLLLAGGCATARRPVWVPAQGAYSADAAGLSAELPAGWTRLNSDNTLLLTRDGLSLQGLGAARYKVGEPLKHAKKTFDKGMLPQEVAGILIDELTSLEDVTSSEVLENVPARLGGVEGFRVVFLIRLKLGAWDVATQSHYRDWKPVAIPFQLLAINTLVLLASSFTLEKAKRQAQDDLKESGS